MNCKPGDLAIVKQSHPMRHIRGKLLEVLWYYGCVGMDPDVWHIRWLGAAQPTWSGPPLSAGYIQDLHLTPLRRRRGTDQTLLWAPIPLVHQKA